MHWLIEQIKWLRGFANPAQLSALIEQYGPLCYLILFAIVFSETGLLIGFFLPGDSLLFAAGFVASTGAFRIELLIAILSVAAILGDGVNYLLGLRMEQYVFEKGRLRFVKHEHLMAAKAFYDRHGGKAIILARFVPLVRTFTPFVAGVAKMSYRQFAAYNIVGGIAWVVMMSLAGYWLGSITFVKEHFEAVVTGIVVLSVVPVAIAALRAWMARRSIREPRSGDT